MIRLFKTIALIGLIAALLPSCQEGKKEEAKASGDRLAMISNYTSTPVKVDGVLDPAEWAVRDTIVIVDDSLRIDNQIIVYSQWDSSYLYFLFDARDTNVQAIQTERDHPRLSADDIIEFLLDTQDDHGTCWDSNDIIYHINPYAQTKDDRGNDSCRSDATWNGEALMAATVRGTVNNPADRDTGYIVEVAVPWKELERSPKPGLVIGANFGGQSDGIYFDWVDAWPFRQPFKFGTLTLK
jgi:hypothetical protein